MMTIAEKNGGIFYRGGSFCTGGNCTCPTIKASSSNVGQSSSNAGRKGLGCWEGTPGLSLLHLCLLAPDESSDSWQSLLTKNYLCFSLTQTLSIG